MFPRKPKNSDVQSSLQRFSDLGRESGSRAKHFRVVIDALSLQERRQFIEEYNFEIFHLIDTILLNLDLSVDAQGVIEAESALWALEQVLCFAPELVGKGWQRYAIEVILKRALHPGNLLAVRKIAIRLFLMWYQTLAVFYHDSDRTLDVVFQNLLPYFPLKNGEPTMLTLQMYCEGVSQCGSNSNSGFDPKPPRFLPIVPNSSQTSQMNSRERAQSLQIYLDKFLEYVTRETTKIEWTDENHRIESIRFLVRKVVALYVNEVFFDIGRNGIDVFESKNINERKSEILDTADPLVIARYWLIRWIVNIASAPLMDEPGPGLALFHDVLFSNELSVNTLLTLMYEAVQLPLACASVMQKVITLIRAWLLHADLPPFLSSKSTLRSVSSEFVHLLLLDFCIAFFRSPYIAVAGDRLPIAVNITHSICEIFRSFSNPLLSKHSYPSAIWAPFVQRLTNAAELSMSKGDAFGSATAAIFSRTLLYSTIFVVNLRDAEIMEEVWDDIWKAFQMGVWTQMIEEWSKCVNSLTHSLLWNLFELEPLEILKESGSMRRSTLHSDLAADSENVDESTERDHFTAIIKKSGQPEKWLRTWMRVTSLVSVADARFAQQSVQTLSRAIVAVLNVESANTLAQWLGDRLLSGIDSVANQPHAIPPLCAIIAYAYPPISQRAAILSELQSCLSIDEVAPIVLEQFPIMNSEDSAVVSEGTIQTLQRLIRNAEFSSRAVRVAALLSLNHPEAEKILMSILSSHVIEVDLPSLTLCVNALSILVIERADISLLSTVFDLIVKHHLYSATLLPLFCGNLACAPRLGFHARLSEALEWGITRMESPLLNELKWQLVVLNSKEKVCKTMKPLLATLAAGGDDFLEGLMIERSIQFPLPGFTITQWNSALPSEKENTDRTFSEMLIQSGNALLSFKKDGPHSVLWSRTAVGRHCFTLGKLGGVPTPETPVQRWLNSLAIDVQNNESVLLNSPLQSPKSSDDPLIGQLLRHNPPSPSSVSQQSSTSAGSTDSAEFLQRIRQSNRKPIGLIVAENLGEKDEKSETASPWEWRQFVSDLRLFSKSGTALSNQQSFARDLRHLDQTSSRELHKVAVIYVAKGQEDKLSILNNCSGSEAFDEFVRGLGWPVIIGPQTHNGYNGGLPVDSVAPYYANAACELIFHVSTLLNGDATQRLKHMGNDEVHVVWTEHSRPYRRDIIATRFCDVLIVLQPVSVALVRVRVETQQPDNYFGPLFDGAQIHIKEVPALVRETVINASRSYRLQQSGLVRPNKHREQVFAETQHRMTQMPIALSITNMYVPSLKS